jgi:hypothetical protein
VIVDLGISVRLVNNPEEALGFNDRCVRLPLGDTN